MATYNLASKEHLNQLSKSINDIVDGKTPAKKSLSIVGEQITPVKNGTATTNVQSAGEYAQFGIEGLDTKKYLLIVSTNHDLIGSIRTMKGWSWETNFGYTKLDKIGYAEVTITSNTSMIAILANASAVGKTPIWNIGVYDLSNHTKDEIIDYVLNPIDLKASDIKKAVDYYSSNVKKICCWGDSITQGDGNRTSGGWVWQLSLLADGYDVTNKGKSSDPFNNIMNRQGCMPIYIKPFTLPADNSLVEVKFYSNCFGDINFQTPDQERSGLGTCTLNGDVDVSVSKSNGKYYISRKVSGNSISYNRAVLLVSKTNEQYRDAITTIFGGTNNSNTFDTQDFIDCQQTMVNYLTTDRFLIIGMTADTRFPNIDELNNAFQKKWGRHFFDAKRYLINFGLADNGLTPTSADEQYIAQNKIPRTLLSDDQVHPNDYGYISLAKGIFSYMKDLGYIK